MGRLKGKARAKDSRKKRLKSRNDFFIKRKRLVSLIRKWDDPILKQICEKVKPDEDISSIIKDLKQVLGATQNGLGLAASQIGYAKRVFAIRPKGVGGDITIFINSDIVEESQERMNRREGCLSYPSFYAIVDRPAELTVQYEDGNRELHKTKFKDMEACIICHEHDHTFGVCLVGDAYDKRNIIEEEKVEKDEVIPEDVAEQS